MAFCLSLVYVSSGIVVEIYVSNYKASCIVFLLNLFHFLELLINNFASGLIK